MKTYSIACKAKHGKKFTKYIKDVVQEYPLYNQASYLPKLFNEFKKTNKL